MKLQLFISSILFGMFIMPISIIIATLYRCDKGFTERTIESVDMVGNIVFANLFNVFLIKGGGYKFGEINHTISYVIGKNKERETLSVFGKILDYCLDIIDKGHSEKVVEYEECFVLWINE